jgi:hypothetical protein
VFSAQNDSKLFPLLHLRLNNLSLSTLYEHCCLAVLDWITHNSHFPQSSVLRHRWQYLFGVKLNSEVRRLCILDRYCLNRLHQWEVTRH